MLSARRDVQRGRERCLRHPDVAGAVRDRLTVLVLRGRCFVVRARRVLRVCSRLVPAHLRIRQSARRLERVDAHVVAKHFASEPVSIVLSATFRSGGRCSRGGRRSSPPRDRLRRHVGRADDLLLLRAACGPRCGHRWPGQARRCRTRSRPRRRRCRPIPTACACSSPTPLGSVLGPPRTGYAGRTSESTCLASTTLLREQGPPVELALYEARLHDGRLDEVVDEQDSGCDDGEAEPEQAVDLPRRRSRFVDRSDWSAISSLANGYGTSFGIAVSANVRTVRPLVASAIRNPTRHAVWARVVSA